MSDGSVRSVSPEIDPIVAQQLDPSVVASTGELPGIGPEKTRRLRALWQQYVETETPEQRSQREADKVGRDLDIPEVLKIMLLEQLAVSDTIKLAQINWVFPIVGPLFIRLGGNLSAELYCCLRNDGSTEGRVKGSVNIKAEAAVGASLNVPWAGRTPRGGWPPKSHPTKKLSGAERQWRRDQWRRFQKKMERHRRLQEARRKARDRFREQQHHGQLQTLQKRPEASIDVKNAVYGNRCQEISWELKFGVEAEAHAGVWLVGVQAKASYTWTWNRFGYQGGKGSTEVGVAPGIGGAQVSVVGVASFSVEWTLEELLGFDPLGG